MKRAWSDSKENKKNIVLSKTASADVMMTIHEVVFNFVGFIKVRALCGVVIGGAPFSLYIIP